MYKTILFDLDGTLTDPALGITNSVAYSLQRFGIEVQDKQELLKFIGPPLADSYMEYYGFSEEKAYEAIEVYREYFSERGIFENKLYISVPEMLKALKGNGKNLIVATSKPEVFAKRILEHFDLSRYFDYCVGSNLDGSRCRKDLVVAHALEISGTKDLNTAVMIGDREHDIKGGQLNGLETVGVLYGYGSKKELTDAGATYIAESVNALKSILID